MHNSHASIYQYISIEPNIDNHVGVTQQGQYSYPYHITRLGPVNLHERL